MNTGDEHSNENFKGVFPLEFTPIMKRLSCRPSPFPIPFPVALHHGHPPAPLPVVNTSPCLMPNYLPLGLVPPPPLFPFYNRSPNALSRNDSQGSLLRRKAETSLPGFLNPLDQVSNKRILKSPETESTRINPAMPRLPSANPQLTFNRAASATQRRPLRPSSSKKRRPASGPPRCEGTFPEAPLPYLQTPSNLLKDTDSIKVAVRVRPFHVDEIERGEASSLAVSGDGKYVSLKTCQKLKTFPFHTCLGPEVGQEEVMSRCGVYELLDAALDGFNVTIFAYGQTGSGKTYTLQENIGIIGRSLGYIFSEINRSKYTIKCSYCEIYNEALYDLINFSGKQLSLKWDHAGKTFYSPELTIHECDRLEEAEKIVAKGNKHRKVGSHALNIESSRSHAIFTVHIVNSEYTDHTFQAGKVVFVDLAGSERLKESHSEGAALRETAAINRSLFMLGKVISALSAGAKGASVPYRESKLTKLLMDALGGHSMTLMIACCSPSSTHADETLNTLNYAMRAKNIQNSPAIQYDPEHIAILSLRKQIQTLQSENAELRNQLFRLRQSTSSSPLVTASSTMLPLA